MSNLMRNPMRNPWEEIDLSDYENHMSLDSVMQLQAMNSMMKSQFDSYPAKSVMILGVAGGNGLAHISCSRFSAIYGVDVNADYLKEVMLRYPHLESVLHCICLDLTRDSAALPHADLLIANLLIEYIGYDAFCRTVRHVSPAYVSCVIQINTDETQWVSDSPYLHVFDGLDEIHHQMDADTLTEVMRSIGYSLVSQSSEALPNGKALVRADYEAQCLVPELSRTSRD